MLETVLSETALIGNCFVMDRFMYSIFPYEVTLTTNFSTELLVFDVTDNFAHHIRLSQGFLHLNQLFQKEF
jgi:hypothetical protein